MRSLAAALLVGLTAMAAVAPFATAAVVPGAEGPAPRRAALSTATTVATHAAAPRVTADGTPCDKVHDDSPPARLSPDGLYGYLAEYGRYLVERFVELLRAAHDTVDRLAPPLNALEASPAGRPPA